MDVGSSEAWAKAPPCIWSPIPPPELRGEPLEDLSTNGGFVSFGMYLTFHIKRLYHVVLKDYKEKYKKKRCKYSNKPLTKT